MWRGGRDAEEEGEANRVSATERCNSNVHSRAVSVADVHKSLPSSAASFTRRASTTSVQRYCPRMEPLLLPTNASSAQPQRSIAAPWRRSWLACTTALGVRYYGQRSIAGPQRWRWPIPPSFAVTYLLCAASLALPLTARGVIFNRQLGLARRPEVLSTYYLAEWATDLSAPLIGWLTDRAGPTVRRTTVVASLVANLCFMVCFAAGLVHSIGSLYGLGLAAASTHSFAKSALNGALVAHRGTRHNEGIRGGSGDTSEARSRQAAALVCMTTGDLLAFATSTGLESLHASPALVFSLTAGLVAVAACAAFFLPLPSQAKASSAARLASSGTRRPNLAPRSLSPIFEVTASAVVTDGDDAASSVSGGSSNRGPQAAVVTYLRTPAGTRCDVTITTDAGFQSYAVDAGGILHSADAIAGASADAIAARSARASSDATDAGPAPITRFGFGSAALLACATVVYMLPPTSFDTVDSYMYRPGQHEVSTWLLSARQLSGMVGSLVGISFMWRLDLPLYRSLPVGALAFALGSLSQLWLLSVQDLNSAGTGWLLLQSALQSALEYCGLVPIYGLAAAAAVAGGEGAGFGLVQAANAGGGEAAGAIAIICVRALGIGEPPGRSWARLPLFVGLCAACKLAVVPVALLLVVGRQRLLKRGESLGL